MPRMMLRGWADVGGRYIWRLIAFWYVLFLILWSFLIEIIRSIKLALVVFSSTLHSRILNGGFSLKFFKAFGLSGGVKILNMLSMNIYIIVYYIYILGVMSFYRGKRNILSHRCRQPVFPLHSHSISQKKSPNSKMLLCITSLRDYFTALVKKSVGSSSWYFSIHSSTWLVPWSVSMLVYIDLASAVKSFAPGGSVPWSVRSWIMWL